MKKNFQFDPDGKLMIRAVLFDFDGTLFETIPLIVESYRHVYRHFGLREHSEAEILAGIGLPLEEIFSEYPDLGEELLNEYQRFNLAHVTRYVGIYRTVPEMLRQLRELGLPLGVVTAKRMSGLRPTLDQFEADTWFDCIVTKEMTRKHKPDPEPLQVGMKALGLEDASEVLYVGDSVHDLRAAANGGFPSAAVSWSAMPRADLEAEQPTLWFGHETIFREVLHPLTLK